VEFFMKLNNIMNGPLILSALITHTLYAQDIAITHSEDRMAARGPATAYTGVGITEILYLHNDESDLTGAEIRFEPGARTSWHNHPFGQYLYITQGVGWVQARGEEKQLVRSGDVVWTPPGVFHWHGATTMQAMTHIAVWRFDGDSGGEFGPLVTDEEYLSELATD
jgi:quercetin dioxygenase-like cupin family protein